MASRISVNDMLRISVLNSRSYNTVRVEFVNGRVVNMAFDNNTLALLQGDPDVVEVMDNQPGELYKHPRCVAVEA